MAVSDGQPLRRTTQPADTLPSLPFDAPCWVSGFSVYVQLSQADRQIVCVVQCLCVWLQGWWAALLTRKHTANNTWRHAP